MVTFQSQPLEARHVSSIRRSMTTLCRFHAPIYNRYLPLSFPMFRFIDGSGPFATFWVRPKNKGDLFLDIAEGEFDEEHFFQHSRFS